MCSEANELTRQTQLLGGHARRFGLSEGDLKCSEARKRLFLLVLIHRPKSLWYSPVCKPWCRWNTLNLQKSIELEAKIIQERFENIWQIALGVVLYRMQISQAAHFHWEQPDGSEMLKVPALEEIHNVCRPCRFDLCRVGNLRDPESQLALRKRLHVLTSSPDLQHMLHGKFCQQEHEHRHIAGSTKVQGQVVPLAKYTELYPAKFARSVAKTLLHGTCKPFPVMASEDAEHPTKRRRLGQKMSPTEIDQHFPSWDTVMQEADRVAPRAGVLVMEHGNLIHMVQRMRPNHDVQHVVLCRGTDRCVGPNKSLQRHEDPVRKRVCIRRHHETVEAEEEWEPWERLTQKGLRRKATPARVSLTVFARVRAPAIEAAPAPEPVIREPTSMTEPRAPEISDPPAAKRFRSSPVEDPTDASVEAPSRQEIDLVSDKHGPLFLQLSKDVQTWVLKLHRNLGHPGAAKLSAFCKQLGCPPEVLRGIPDLKCSTCIEQQAPRTARPAAIHTPGDFGDVVSMDAVKWTNQSGQQFLFYHFVDQSTSYQTAVIAPSNSSQAAIQAFTQGWISWAGPPGLLCVDAATELNSEEFASFLQKHGIPCKTIAPEAHWQNARAERHGGILQGILSKMDVAGSVVSDNSMSSHTAALGETPDGIRFREELALRERARKAFSCVDNEQALRRALVHRSRPSRGTYNKGDWVMIWKKMGEADGQWQGPFQVVIQESSQVMWVTGHGKRYRIAPEHVRPLSAVEEINHRAVNQTASSPDIGQQSIIPSHGGGQYHNLFPDNSTSPQAISNTIPNNSPNVTNIDIPSVTPSANVPIPISESEGSQQPDDEPSAQEETTPEGNVELPNPVEVPIADEGSDDGLVCEDCWHVAPDHAWCFEVDICQNDINKWRREEHPHEMAFLVSAAKRQRSEVRLSELTAEEKKLFDQAKRDEIDSWVSTETIAKVLRHQIPTDNILRCRWILTWKDSEDKGTDPSVPVSRRPKARLVVLGYEDPQALSQKFPFGSRKQKDFVFTGLHIKQSEDFSITVDQEQYVKDIHPISITRERRAQQEDVVNERERQSLRAVIGSLLYAAVNTRPDLGSRLGWLQSQVNKAKVATLIEANKILHEAKDNAKVSIRAQPIPVDDLRFVAFSDASFASERTLDSHQGMMIMSAHRKIGENQSSPVNPICWHSKKIQRVAVSTLSAEAMALACAVDHLSWVRLYWAWLMDAKCDWRNADSTLPKLPTAFSAIPPSEDTNDDNTAFPSTCHQYLKQVNGNSFLTTDCKSLYDLISRTAPPACQEFRTLLQAKLIKEHLQNGIQIRWVPSGAQIADALTKVMDSTVLRACLKSGWYSLHDENEILRARSDKRSQLQWLQQHVQSPTAR
eukprot:s1308_g3.t1